jgi:hypothetical protein
MLQEQSQKRLKPILRFIEEDAPFRRSHTLKLIAEGTIRTVKIGKRKYVDMVAWQRQEAGLPPIAAG